MPRYATSFSMAWRLRGVNPTVPDQHYPIAWRLRGLNAMVRDQHSSMAWRLRGLNATVPDQLPHGLAIKGVKCHATRPASPWPGD
uniref:Uncharacterized protein n=1 Tax=Escherichia coli TaxID=562 RepID=A0A6H1PYL8_ECOLX|nr:hypothetical protein pRW7-1_235k_tetX_00241 [Escherichia coli]